MLNVSVLSATFLFYILKPLTFVNTTLEGNLTHALVVVVVFLMISIFPYFNFNFLNLNINEHQIYTTSKRERNLVLYYY